MDEPMKITAETAQVQITEEEVDELVKMGGLAPSGGNVQAWKVVAFPDRLELSLDPRNARTFLDVAQTASLFSLGSFLENVCLTADALGLRYEPEIRELKTLNDPVVILRFVGRKPAPSLQDPLFGEIPRRHTNRRLHVGSPLEDSVLDDLRSALTSESTARLRATSDVGAKTKAAAVLGQADALRMRHSTMFRDMMSEIRWDQQQAERTGDGVAISTLELPAPVIVLMKLLRTFPALHRALPRGPLEKAAAPSVLGCSHLCLLSMQGPPTGERLIAAGRALERLWLKASLLSLSVQPMTVLTFMLLRARFHGAAGLEPNETQTLLELGRELDRLFGLGEGELPIFLFRLSRSEAASDKALRRPHSSIYESRRP
jgi:hypothetical protein